MSLDEDFLSKRLFVSLNSIGTAAYDPYHTEAEFLQKKEQRHRQADITVSLTETERDRSDVFQKEFCFSRTLKINVYHACFLFLFNTFRMA